MEILKKQYNELLLQQKKDEQKIHQLEQENDKLKKELKNREEGADEIERCA